MWATCLSAKQHGCSCRDSQESRGLSTLSRLSPTAQIWSAEPRCDQQKLTWLPQTNPGSTRLIIGTGFVTLGIYCIYLGIKHTYLGTTLANSRHFNLNPGTPSLQDGAGSSRPGTSRRKCHLRAASHSSSSNSRSSCRKGPAGSVHHRRNSPAGHGSCFRRSAFAIAY